MALIIIKTALSIGITAQDGLSLVELLLEIGYNDVHGTIRHSSVDIGERIVHLDGNFH